MTPDVLIAGVSVRGMAESAVRAGYTVTAIDAYSDVDLMAIADTRLVTPYSADAAAIAAHELLPRRGSADPSSVADRTPGGDARARSARGDTRATRSAADWDGAVCYVSNFENNPDAVRELARGRRLWGNSPATLSSARTPREWAHALAAAGFVVPRHRSAAPRTGTSGARIRWLLKPRRSGGGHGIRLWTGGIPVPRRDVLQERIPGSAGSIAFAADGRQAIPIAVTRQLIGERALGAPPFRYCGNILSPTDDPQWGMDTPVWRAAAAIAHTATRAFGLVGVNGIDFINRRAQPVPIEINPRFTAAMEVAERRDGISIFAAHVAGCSGVLGSFASLATSSRGTGAAGKAIVFARGALTVGAATPEWMADPDIRDIPRPHTHIPRGAPICSVFAAAPTSAECHARLLEQAERIYETVGRKDWILAISDPRSAVSP